MTLYFVEKINSIKTYSGLIINSGINLINIQGRKNNWKRQKLSDASKQPATVNYLLRGRNAVQANKIAKKTSSIILQKIEEIIKTEADDEKFYLEQFLSDFELIGEDHKHYLLNWRIILRNRNVYRIITNGSM